MSGTGNTKHCVERFLNLLENTDLTEGKLMDKERESIENIDDIMILIEDSQRAVSMINEHDEILLAYPTQFSNVPYMVRDFINKNSKIWAGKKVLCMTTMGAFSGDGAGCSARILKKYGAHILGGIHLRMPDAVCDNKMLKKPLEENKEIVKKTDERIENIVIHIKKTGEYPKDGLSIIAHMAGLFGQRLWFYNKTTDYSKKLKISDACVGCGLCTKNCPMHNLSIRDGKVVSNNKCAMCYKCISTCPKMAITLLGSKVYEQVGYEKYAPDSM